MYESAAGGTDAAVGNCTVNIGGAAKLTATFEVNEKNANGAIEAPPMFCGRRRMSWTVGVPLGWPSENTSVIVATAFAAPTVNVPL
jgi:hypothetical protein